MRWYEFITETATAGATSSGSIASVPGGLWTGPVLGRYPYITPDYRKVGMHGGVDAIPRAEPKKSRKKKKSKTRS